MIENKSLGSKIFDILNVVILIAVTLICIVPVWYVLCVSLSSREAVNAGQVALWPVGFNLLSYKKIMGETAFFGSFLVSIKRVLLGTGISMVSILIFIPSENEVMMRSSHGISFISVSLRNSCYVNGNVPMKKP